MERDFLFFSTTLVVCVGCGSDAFVGSPDAGDDDREPAGSAQVGDSERHPESQGTDGGSPDGSDGGGEVDDAQHWSKRFGGTKGYDYGLGVAVDGADHIVVTGQFWGAVDFGGGPLAGGDASSILLAKYDPAGNHVWSKSFGGLGLPRGGGAGVGETVATDGAGNIAVTGGFQGTVDFGGGPFVSAGDGEADVFIARYDAAGNHLWSKRFGDGSLDAGTAVAIDVWGNVIVTGLFEGTVDAGGGPLTSAGADDIFVVKYDSAGQHLWSKRFGSSDSDRAHAIATDAAGNILVTGGFRGTVDFGGGPLTTSAINDYDVFLAKYDAGGAHLWSKRLGSSSLDEGFGVAVDGQGNIVVSGNGGAIDFGGGPLTKSGIFLAKYDDMGNHLWSKAFGEGWGEGVAFDPQGNIVLVGGFWLAGGADFGGGPLSNAGGIYVSKFNGEGNHLWSKGFGDSQRDRAYAVATNSAADIVVTGAFHHSVNFGNGPLTSAGAGDIFLAKLGP